MQILEGIGKSYHDHRRQVMLARQEGLTRTYNRFHAPDETAADIQTLRDLHVEMDRAVAAAYGWDDLDLGHGFHETRQGTRFTISEPARREVLARLLTLNHQRHAEEVAQRLHDAKSKRTAFRKPTPKKPAKKAAAASSSTTLFDLGGVDTAFPGSEQDRRLCGLLCDLVAARPGLPSDAYLDALVIALSPERSSRLLIGEERARFLGLAAQFPATPDEPGTSIPWEDLRSLLVGRGALRTATPGTLQCGDRFDEVRASYPTLDPGFVRSIHDAASTLRELRDPATPASPESGAVLSEFDREKRTLVGASP